jgi:murein DD-endopeptidase MepM/ murein hydrolase activator NlpD
MLSRTFQAAQTPELTKVFCFFSSEKKGFLSRFAQQNLAANRLAGPVQAARFADRRVAAYLRAMGTPSLMPLAAVLALLTAGGAAAADLPRVALKPPVRAACITSPFGWRHALGPLIPAGFHNGVDLAAPEGGEVRAAARGTVAAIRRRGAGGLWVMISHPGGMSTLYAHLGTIWGRITDGQRQVAAGDPIGHVGYTGLMRGTHLFFAVFQNGEAVDPEPLLGVPRCGGGGGPGKK